MRAVNSAVPGLHSEAAVTSNLASGTVDACLEDHMRHLTLPILLSLVLGCTGDEGIADEDDGGEGTGDEGGDDGSVQTD